MKKTFIVMATTFLTLATIWAYCAQAVEAPMEKMDKAAYEKQIQEKINDLESKIDKLKVELNEKNEPGVWDRLVNNLQDAQNAASEKFSELKEASADTWKNVKSQFETAMTKTEEAYNTLRVKYYQANVKEELETLDERITELQAKSSILTGEAQEMVKENLETMQETKDFVSNEIHNIATVKGQQLDYVQKGIDQALNNADKAYKKSIESI